MIIARLVISGSNAQIKIYEKGNDAVQIVPDITTIDSAYMWFANNEFKLTSIENIFIIPRLLGKGVLTEGDKRK